MVFNGFYEQFGAFWAKILEISMKNDWKFDFFWKFWFLNAIFCQNLNFFNFWSKNGWKFEFSAKLSQSEINFDQNFHIFQSKFWISDSKCSKFHFFSLYPRYFSAFSTLIYSIYPFFCLYFNIFSVHLSVQMSAFSSLLSQIQPKSYQISTKNRHHFFMRINRFQMGTKFWNF